MKKIKTMLSLGAILLLSSTSVMAMPVANMRAVCLHSYSSWSKTDTYWSSVGTSSVCRDEYEQQYRKCRACGDADYRSVLVGRDSSHSYSMDFSCDGYWDTMAEDCRDCSYSRINKSKCDGVHPYNLEEK